MDEQVNSLEEKVDFDKVVARHSSDLVCIHAPDKSIVHCSRSVRSLLGYDPAEFSGRELLDFFHEQFRSEMDEGMLARMLYREGAAIRIMLRRKDGAPIWLSMKWVNEARRTLLPEGFSVSVCTDVTESVLLTEDLMKAWSQEKEIHDLRQKLLTMASHEFKTPLAVLQMQLDILRAWEKEEDKSERHLHLFGKMQKQVDRLDAMIKDIVASGKATQQKNPFYPIPLEWTALVASEIEKAQEGHPQRKITLEEHGGAQLMQADEQMARYVVSNLLSNALKYSKAPTEVRCILEYGKDALSMRVEDEGIGIPQDEQTRIFEPFYRAANALNIEGTGAALSVIREFVNMHRGEMRVDSTEDKGSCFHIYWPYERS